MHGAGYTGHKGRRDLETFPEFLLAEANFFYPGDTLGISTQMEVLLRNPIQVGVKSDQLREGILSERSDVPDGALNQMPECIFFDPRSKDS